MLVNCYKNTKKMQINWKIYKNKWQRLKNFAKTKDKSKDKDQKNIARRLTQKYRQHSKMLQIS